MSKFTHKIVWKSKDGQLVIQVHRSDSVQRILNHYSGSTRRADEVTIQAYPLKNNPVEYIKQRSD